MKKSMNSGFTPKNKEGREREGMSIQSLLSFLLLVLFHKPSKSATTICIAPPKDTLQL